MKVRTGGIYTFDPVGWDRFDPKTDLKPGERVKVLRLPGCPPPNTMGHCHVARKSTGKFAGLVSTASLS